MAPDFSQLTLRQMPHAVVVTDVDGAVLHWNRAAARLFGYAPDEASSRTLAALIVPTDLVAEDEQARRHALARGEANLESFRQRRDGSLARVDIVYTRVVNEPSSPTMLLVTMQDVTQLRARRDAGSVGASYAKLLDSTPDAIVIANQTGHVVLANTHAHTLFGYPPGELVGQPVETLLPERLRQVHVAHRHAYRAQPRTRAMGMGLELHGRRKDGSEFPVEISLCPLEVNGDAMVMSAIRDITDRKRIQRELEQKNAELAAANHAKDTFLANMSHELRPPLHGIIGYTGTLLMRLPGALNDEQQDQLRTVRASAHHLLELINELLDVARLNAGRTEFHLTEQDIGAIALDVVAALRPQAETKGLALELKLPEAPLFARTDARALRQILINLVGNAIKFTGEGSVLLAARRSDGVDPDALELSVADTGPGIADEDRERIFQPFERLADRIDPATEGTGLGLYLSLRLAEQLGGAIRVEPREPRGSVFVLRLPVT